MVGNVEVINCDYLIVGAGSSGSVLASRLVRRGLNVVLVESGPCHSVESPSSPKHWFQAASSGYPVSEVFVTEPQSSFNGRQVLAFRGIGGGGTSNVNATLYFRGRREDYDNHWPWKLEDVEASFKSIESELLLENHRSPGTVGASFERMLEQAGFELATTPVTNVGAQDSSVPRTSGEEDEPTWTPLGFTREWKCTTSDGGRKRVTAWTSFMRPILYMGNLKVRDRTVVRRVVIEEGRAVGVEVVERGKGWASQGLVREIRFAGASTEVVLCGGVFRSPKMLMLSGVGPKQHLEDMKIPVAVDSQHVGSNLHDHLIIGTCYPSKKPIPKEHYKADSIHGHVYFSCKPPGDTARGPIPGSPADAAAVAAAAKGGGDDDDDDPVAGYLIWDGQNLADNLSRFVPDLFLRPGILMMILYNIAIVFCWVLRLTLVRAFLCGTRVITVVVTTVRSRGTVRLRSADPAAPPRIDPAYLTHPEDGRVACEAWRRLRRAVRETPEGQASLGRDLLPGPLYRYGEDDESFTRWSRDMTRSFFHPVGTCRMGSSVEDSVVSSETLRVHGVSGLRVVDASIAPRAPSVPTQAMAMMIGDRAASIILKDKFAAGRVRAAIVEAAGKSIN